MKKQIYNPIFPLNVCIPDGEPHVFGDRIYVFGSNEEAGGREFCTLVYEFFSAPVNDLTEWSSKGINYAPDQDPTFGEKNKYMYAPDVVQGNDGRYYLYYAMSGGGGFTSPIHVAACDTPDGKYEYYGEVRNADGSAYTRKITFDPAVINDDGIIRLYYGWALAVDKDTLKRLEQNKTSLNDVLSWMFGKTKEEIENEPDGIMGAYTVELEEDMLTVKTQPKRIVVGQFDSVGTPFEGHAFFEGSSIRKINDRYYFIYSSEQQHELCYATSRYPDRDFRFGGTIVSNGDIGCGGRKAEERLAVTGNNHGSIEKINGNWYVFYHRQTHKTSFSRQACAEEITIGADGDIAQAEITSQGLNGGALMAEGRYPAAICCNLTNGKMPHVDPQTKEENIPAVTHSGNDFYVGDLSDGCEAVFKYFEFTGNTILTLTIRGDEGIFKVNAGGVKAEKEIAVSKTWQKISFSLDVKGIVPVSVSYCGKGKIDFSELCFEKEKGE